MANVTLTNVKKIYPGGVTAVHESSLEIVDKEFMVLVGPSGCGKTTTLRMVAGLEEITAGTIEIGGRVVNDVLPKDRDIAMVFQNYAIYPHMSVYDNLAFGLKQRKYPRAEIARRVEDAAKVLGIEQLLGRRPKALSGGQRQRVALGRAIVREPKVFLFDEPLSNLDAKMRVEMRKEIKMLHQRLKTTMIYVTHDQVEAMTMGDRIGVMNLGRFEQVGTPLQVYDHPQTRFVAAFIGTPPMNFMKGELAETGGRLVFSSPGFAIPLPDSFKQIPNVRGGLKAELGVRPEDFILAETPEEKAFSIPCKVQIIEALGNEQLVYVKINDNMSIWRCDAHMRLAPGDDLLLSPNPERLHLFDNETKLCITHK